MTGSIGHGIVDARQKIVRHGHRKDLPLAIIGFLGQGYGCI